MKTGFRIKRVQVSEKGFSYRTYRLTGWLNGRRIREQFTSSEQAGGRKNELEVEAANLSGLVRARATRLTEAQLSEAEAAFTNLGGRSLSAAVNWFLTTYRPPQTAMALDVAIAKFKADRAAHVRPIVLRNYKHTLQSLSEKFPGAQVHKIATADVQAFLTDRGEISKKRFNNLRGELHTFFEFCRRAPQQWTTENPVAPIPFFKITRGLPAIITAKQAAELMAYVETYAGGERSDLQPGCLVPYFALCLFAGLRPSVKTGEIAKLAAAGAATAINPELGTIRISPEVSKVKSVRQVTIQSNLAQWLLRYPIKQFPILPPNALRLINHVRHKFALSADVLRHTFISMHVAKFKSLGEAALEAGNSESMIKRHYYNTVSAADAVAFWAIAPGRQTKGEVISLSAAC